MKYSLILLTKLTILAFTLASCEKEDSKISLNNSVTDETLISTTDYFKKCEEELGQMPEVIDCRAGERIEFDDLQLDLSDAHGDPKCKNPSFGVDQADGCLGNSYLVRQQTSAGTDVVSVCRFAGKENELSVAAVIAYNPVTGGTCFYQFKKQTAYSKTGKLPGPRADLKTEQIEKNWESPAYITNVRLGTCVECHSAYPWVRNPFVLGTKNKLTSTPENGNKTSPYWVVARQELEQHLIYRSRSKTWEKATDLWTPVVLDEKALKPTLTKELTLCLNCHRMGRGRFLKGWSALAVGYHSFPSDEIQSSRMEQQFNSYANRLSDSARQYPANNWHQSLFKTSLKTVALQTDWKTALEKPMQLVFECGNLPKNCVWRALPEPQSDGTMKEPALSQFPYIGRDLQNLSQILGGVK